ncbi:MAG: hypothetical protein ACC644_05820 [Candidatus Hydrothermarchaeales archaeon]
MKHTINVYLEWKEDERDMLESWVERYSAEGFKVEEPVTIIYGEGFENKIKEGYIGMVVMHRQIEDKS